MARTPTQEELEAQHCWENEDRAQGRPDITAFRRALRWHQARWRQEQGHPIGTQPIKPRTGGGPGRLVGSRLPLDYAIETGANFLTSGALSAARERTSFVEPHQSFDHQRLWADLLWSPTLAFNLFGDLSADLDRADASVHAWWPDTPGTVAEVLFAHSPGRLDPAYLNSLRAFDTAFVLARPDGTRGILAIDVKYHERMKPELPRPDNLGRYIEIAERSGVFRAGAVDMLRSRSELAEIWLEHLLLHSMLLHESGAWTWGRYVVVYPAGNPAVAHACNRYRELLTEPSAFASLTMEDLLAARVLPRATTTALRKRYLPGI